MEEYYTAAYRQQGFLILKNFLNVAFELREKYSFKFDKKFIEENYVALSENTAISPEGLHNRLKVLQKDICGSFTSMGYKKTSYAGEGDFLVQVKW